MNGDVDGVCSFLADEWFVEDFASTENMRNASNRLPWMYQQGPGMLSNVGGFVKKFKHAEMPFEIDLVTVKVEKNFLKSLSGIDCSGIL